jgi:hypothetical protein
MDATKADQINDDDDLEWFILIKLHSKRKKNYKISVKRIKFDEFYNFK